MQSPTETEKAESHRRSSSSGSESDDFSLWSDTGDLAEQLAIDEDPLQIELDPLTREGQRLKGSGHGGGRKKRVGFREQHHHERHHGPPGIDKEAIFIPEPPPRHITKTEKLLALIMAPNDPQQARTKGLVGKPLLYDAKNTRRSTWALANNLRYFTSVFVSLGVFLFGYDQGVMSGIITYVLFASAGYNV